MNNTQIIPPGISPKKESRDTTFKVLAGVGVVIVVVLLGWIGARAVGNLPDGVSGIAGVFGSSGSRERIVVTATPAVATSSDTVTVAWEHLNKQEDGSYTFRYDCHEGVEFAYASDDSEETIFCNVPVNVMNASNTLRVTAVSNDAAHVETTITIDFTENGDTNVSRSGETALIIINPELMPEADENGTTTAPVLGPEVGGASVVTTPTPTAGGRQTQTFTFGTTTPVRFSDPNGTPDLVIRVLDTGTASGNGTFTHKDPVDTNDDVAIKFEVRNDGTKETGSWRFEADLPTRPSRDFRSPTQESLFPGERIEYVLRFDRIKRDPEITVRIELDPDDLIDELSERNNDVSVDIATNA